MSIRTVDTKPPDVKNCPNSFTVYLDPGEVTYKHVSLLIIHIKSQFSRKKIHIFSLKLIVFNLDFALII